MTKTAILVIDQGTTNSRSVLFNLQGEVLGIKQMEITPYFPQEAWVEHDPEEIWQTVLTTLRQVMREAKIAVKDIVGLGLTNQRETTVLWDRRTGKAVYPAIVWQDRRTYDICQKLISEGKEKFVKNKTGLLLDPYFSATKIEWILKHVPLANSLLKEGHLLFGTIDSYLIWRLTGGRSHVTDITNAARTLLFNIHTQAWDHELLNLFGIPETILPTVLANTHQFGETHADILGETLPILGCAGDQQAALIGQACFEPGRMKATFGTGCFMILNTGNEIIHSKNRLLSTIAYKIGNQVHYGLEGSVFIAGAAVQWLRDAMKFIHTADETESLALSLTSNDGVYLVPAFTGLGAPYWDPLARGAILGLTRNTGIAHIVRAALEAVCYQTKDLLLAMQADGAKIDDLRVDGGMVRNHWLMQFLADVLNMPVYRAKINETTALGAAYLVGYTAGYYPSLAALSQLWQYDTVFHARSSVVERNALYEGWLKAVNKIKESD